MLLLIGFIAAITTAVILVVMVQSDLPTVGDQIEKSIINEHPNLEGAIFSINTLQKQALNWLKDRFADKEDFSKREVLQLFRLVSLYYSTGGKAWTNQKKRLIDSTDECDWYGINCTADSEILELDLSNNNLVGVIPGEITGAMTRGNSLTSVPSNIER